MRESRPHISIIAAISAHDRGLGKNGNLLWDIPADRNRFKKLTLGHPVVMGRKTFESIVSYIGRALPFRTNIVVTRNLNWYFEGALPAHSLDEALDMARDIEREEIFIGGGSEIYKEALPHATKLYLTLIDGQKEADAFFPSYEQLFTKKVFEEERETPGGLRFRWIDLERESR